MILPELLKLVTVEEYGKFKRFVNTQPKPGVLTTVDGAVYYDYPLELIHEFLTWMEIQKLPKVVPMNPYFKKQLDLPFPEA